MPITRSVAGPPPVLEADAVADVLAGGLGDACAPSTTTFARAPTSASVYQRPSSMRGFDQRPRGQPPGLGVAALEPDVVLHPRLCLRARPRWTRSSGRRRRRAACSPPTGSRRRSGCRRTMRAAVAATPAPSESSASRVATASAICSAVARLRRLRRPSPRSPIWACGAGSARAATAPSSRPWPPTAEPDACSASASGSRAARRIAGSAASGGPDEADHDARDDDRDRDAEAGVDVEERRREEPDERVGEQDAERRPASAPSAPSSSAVRR